MRTPPHSHRHGKWALLGVALLVTVTALACQVPVFRYALERWANDPYLIVVKMPGHSSDAAKQALATLQAAQKEDGSGANITIHVFNDETPAEKLEKMPAAVQELARATEPTMGVFYPPPAGLQVPPVWTGALTPETAAQTLDSPLRQAIIKDLLKGQSAVWVLVQSGDKVADNKAEAVLKAALKKLSNEIELPEGVVTEEEAAKAEAPIDPENVLESTVPLRISFSIQRISHKDAKEAIFLNMLLKSESDLGEYADKPMAFPIFGRGRSLYALVGAGITEENVTEACVYLTSACSCQVKAQNPGLDLLTNMDWESAMAGSDVMEEKSLPPLVGVGELTEEPNKTKEPAAGQPTEASLSTETAVPVVDETRSAVVSVALTVLIGIALALAGGTWFLMRADK